MKIEENNVTGYWKGKTGSQRNFIALSNFSLKLTKHIRAPAKLPQYSGFLLTVSQRQCSRNVSSQERYTVVQRLVW